MKRHLIQYAIITSAFLALLLIATISTYSIQKDIRLAQPEQIKDFSYTIVDNASFNFSQTLIEALHYNDSVTINELLSFSSQSGFSDMVITFGSVENQSSIAHGFVELLIFTQAGSSLELKKEAIYVDKTINNETNFLKGQFSNDTNVGLEPWSLFLLKQVGQNYTLDILTYDTDQISLNASIEINPTVFEEVWDFAVFDKENDQLLDVYFIGSNNTGQKIALVEFQLNISSMTLSYQQAVSWNFQGNTFVGFEFLVESSSAHFLIGSVVLGSPLYTRTTVFSMQRTSGSLFTLKSNESYLFGSDIFRAYSMKLLYFSSSDTPQLALFGTYMPNGLDSYPNCLVVSVTNGTLTESKNLRLSETPRWALTGFVADLNLDAERELIVFSYDFLSSSKSRYSIYSGSNMLEVVAQELHPLSRVRRSIAMEIAGRQMGIILGEDENQNLTISFHQLDFLAFKLKANANHLLESCSNSLLLETYNLSGEIISRTDLNATLDVQGLFTFTSTADILPHIFSFDVPTVSGQVPSLELSLFFTKGAVVVFERKLILDIVFSPEISVVVPGSPVVIRWNESSTRDFSFTFKNKVSSSLTCQIILSSSQRTKQLQAIVQGESTLNKIVPFTFDRPTDARKHTENITIMVNSPLGKYSFNYSLTIRSSLFITYNDLFTALIILLVITIVGYFVFMVKIANMTMEQLRQNYLAGSTKETNITFKVFEKQARRNLLRKCLQRKDWQVGLKVAEEFAPELVPSFQKFKAIAQLQQAQKLLNKENFSQSVMHLESAREAFEQAGLRQEATLLVAFLNPLKKILDAIEHMKGLEKVTMLQKEFQSLLNLKAQREKLYDFSFIDFPYYLIAKELGLAFKENNDLQNALNFLQIAYQDAPNGIKNDLVLEITDLIRLGLTPKELTIPEDFEAIKERLKKKKIKCYNCGTERLEAEELCPNCGLEALKCAVCKLPISFGAKILECPHCQASAHAEHLLEWVKVKGTCPVCQQKILLENLSSIVPPKT